MNKNVTYDRRVVFNLDSEKYKIDCSVYFNLYNDSIEFEYDDIIKNKEIKMWVCRNMDKNDNINKIIQLKNVKNKNNDIRNEFINIIDKQHFLKYKDEKYQLNNYENNTRFIFIKSLQIPEYDLIYVQRKRFSKKLDKYTVRTLAFEVASEDALQYINSL
jgi:hypothetical protein